jgi:hypothetical protein
MDVFLLSQANFSSSFLKLCPNLQGFLILIKSISNLTVDFRNLLYDLVKWQNLDKGIS